MTIREAVTYHEAGHAVAAYHFRNRIRERGVSIDAAGNGEVHTHPQALLAEPRSPRCEQKADWDIIEILAGPLSELRAIHGRSPSGFPDSDSSDLQTVHEYLDRLGCDTDYALCLYADETRRLLRRPGVWPAVRDVAERLLQDGHLSATDVETICHSWKVPKIRKSVWIGKEVQS